MKVKGLIGKNRIFYYCVACGDWFEIDEGEQRVCEHFIGWEVEKVEDDEFEDFEIVVELNYEVKITKKEEV
jgi:hypothetical protein